MLIGINRRRLLLGAAAALPLLGGLDGTTFAATTAKLQEELRMAEVRLRVARDRYAKGQIPLSNVQAREREVEAARAALQGGGTSASQSSSNSSSSARTSSSGDIAALEEELRMAEVRLRVARDRYAKREIPLSNVQAREREVDVARAALRAAQNGGGTSTSQSSADKAGSQTSTGREQYVSTAGQLDAAIRSAGPGSRIILNAGSYGQSSNFLVRASGSSGKPLVIVAKSGARATLTRNMIVYGAHVQIVGLTFNRTKLSVLGANCRVSRCTFNNSATAIYVQGARDVEIDRNQISGWSSRAIEIDPSDGGRIASNPYIHHNHLLNSSNNASIGIGIGQQPSDSNLRVNARVEFNLFENCNIDQNILIKCSNNKVHYNTILNGGAIINRHGKDNSYFGNFARNSKGLWILDINNAAEENRLENSQILVIAGDLKSSELRGQVGGYPRAENLQLRNNFATRTTVGRVFSGSGRRLPALNTTINGHSGRIDLATQQNTRISNQNSSSAGRGARQTSRSQVGPSA